MDSKGGDDDEAVIEIDAPPLASAKPSSPEKQPHYKLDVTAASELAESKDTSEIGQLVRQAEAMVLVVFELDDGSEAEREFMMGQTVECLKAFVESECGVPMRTQRMFIGDTVLIDPLSLADYPALFDPREDVVVRVEGEFSSAESKK